MFTRVLHRIVWRAAVSAVGGLLITAFATAALAFGSAASTDRLAVGRTLSESAAPALTAVAGAGFLATVVVFACLVANDVVRAAGPWLVARRGLLLGPLRAFTWSIAHIALVIVVALQFVVRSTVVVEAVWLARVVGRAAGSVLVGLITIAQFAMIVGGFALVHVGLILISLTSITESTARVVAILDDPPRPLAMALGFGGAAALMYIGVGALALCLWLPYHMVRAGQRRAARRAGTVAS